MVYGYLLLNTWAINALVSFQRLMSCQIHTFQSSSYSDETVNHLFMGMAIEEAQAAGRRGEVPIGAIVVLNQTVSECESTPSIYRFKVASRGRNSVEKSRDASAHAEVVALRRAAQRLGNWRLLGCTLYTTVEPCPMCLAAAQAFRVERIVYGAPDLRLGAIKTHMTLLDVKHPFHEVSSVEGGVRETESANLLRAFFRQRREG